ncbi:MAG: hypothetical protein JRI23_06565, partial [Deltaproteobacteria bacterium]|nr:hypothetical protein [Deltaproteobacteria bacterium]MBW2531251.1 hypothetical protein [Deltaproteobacteria bacterium]
MRLPTTAIPAVLLLASASAEAQNPTVPAGHPRVYVRAADLPAIQAKLTDPSFAEAWNDVDQSTEPIALAFKYLVQGDTAAGQSAVSAGLSALQACTDARVFDQAMHWGACIYDWCYDLLTSGQRQSFITEFERIAGSHAPGFPADPDGAAVVGHGTEGWLLTGQLPAGVAIYDESTTMYDAAATLFVNRFVPVRDYYYPGHMHHQGDSYIGRFAHDQAASWLFRRMHEGSGDADVVDRAQQYVPYQILYWLRPDGQQLRAGDTYDDRGRSSAKRLIAMMTGSYYEDPALLWLADSDIFWNPSDYHRVLELLFRPASVTPTPPDTMPRTWHFAMPMGEMVARTGWTLGIDSPDTVVQMRIGGTFFGNHQRKDFGSFQIYHRGPLAISSGVYQGDNCSYGCDHWRHYHHQTISQNSLLIYDPDEEMILGGSPAANDGGQLWPNDGRDHPAHLETLQNEGYELGEVTAWSFGPDPTTPRYSTIAGDITAAYHADKASLVHRAMVTFATDDTTYPAIVMTFDRVTSTSADFEKTWLLHSIEEPTIDGSTATIVRDGPNWDASGTYGGKLVLESLLPDGATLTKVGGSGREFWVEGSSTNYAVTKGGAAEPGAWRVEVSPSTPATADRFLHVMTTMGSSESTEPTVVLVQENGHVGASADGWTAIWSESGELLTSGALTLTGASSYRVLACDLTPGWWYVSVDDTVIATEEATDDGKSIYFEGGPGDYQLEP